MRNPGISALAVVAASVMLLFSGPFAMTARGQTGSEGESAPEKRDRLVGQGFPLEKELPTDRSVETWLYVFSSLMLLAVGWLCFKPTRVYAGKGEGGFFSLGFLSKKKGKPKKGK